MKTFLSSDYLFKIFIFSGAFGGFEYGPVTWEEWSRKYTAGFISAGITPFLS